MDKLLSSNIKTVFQLFTDGKATVTELVNRSLEKAHRLKKYNAFITLTENEAREKSKESTQRFQAGKPLSEIDGVPIAIKDNFCTFNIKTTCASQMLANFIPTYSATVYQRLLNAGAILIGKTNLDQFAMGSGTVDSFSGPAKNHWGYNEDNDNFYISGGSSGGSAISVATGTCFAALGSDTGGSTRNPASYCGLVGLKPTYGLVSRYGLIPLVNSMDAPGILTRSVDDCVFVLNCIAGPDPKDSTSLTRPYRKIRLPAANKLSITNLKIGIPREYHCEHLDEEVLETWNEIAKFLVDSGAEIQEVFFLYDYNTVSNHYYVGVYAIY